MAGKPIKQRISLEGGEQVKAQLESLGEAGRKAFADLKAATEKAGDMGTAEFAKIEAAAQNFGKAIRNAGTAFADFGKRASVATAAVVAAGAAFAAFVASAGSAADEAAKSSARAGLDIRTYGRLKFAFDQSGVGAEQAARAFNNLNEALADDKPNAVKAALDKLGISIRRTATGAIDVEGVLGDIADRFAAMPDGATKSAIAMEIFGKKVGAQLIPFLNEGRKGLTALGDEAEKLGLVFTAEQGKIGTALNDAASKFGATITALKNQVGIVFGPLLTDVFERLSTFVASLRGPFVAFAQAVEQNIRGPVQELLAAVTGDNSKVQSSWIIGLVGAVKALGAAVSATVTGVIVPAFNGLVLIAQQAANAINGIFGINFTGQQLLVIAGVIQLTGALTALIATVKLIVTGIGLLVAVFGGINEQVRAPLEPYFAFNERG